MQAFTSIRSFVFSPIVIYIFRCLIGFAIGYKLMHLFPEYDVFWAVLSILLVISPEGKDAARLTTERVKANLVGAVSGISVSFLPISIYYEAMLAIAIAALLCYMIRLLIVARTAVVSVIIILIERPYDGFMASLERFLAVLLGCLIGLIVVVTTGYLIRFLHKKVLKVEYKLKDFH